MRIALRRSKSFRLQLNLLIDDDACHCLPLIVADHFSFFDMNFKTFFLYDLFNKGE